MGDIPNIIGFGNNVKYRFLHKIASWRIVREIVKTDCFFFAWCGFWTIWFNDLQEFTKDISNV